MTTSATTRLPVLPASTSAPPVVAPKLRYRANPLRPIETPLNSKAYAAAHAPPRPTGFKTKTTKASTAKSNPLTTQSTPTTTSSQSIRPTPPPAVLPNGAGASATGAIKSGDAGVTVGAVVSGADPTTLPRGRVTDVFRRIEDGVHKTTLKVSLNTGEERSVLDSGVEAIRVSPDLQVGDFCSLTPTGPASFQWTKDADATIASSKPKRKRRVFLVDDLIGEQGIPRLLSSLPSLRWKGLGHEATDLHRLMFIYRCWAKEMYPFEHFDVVVKRCEVMGASSRVQRYMDAFRHPEEEEVVEERGGKRMRTEGEEREEEQRRMDEAAVEMMQDVYGEEGAVESEAVDLLREAKVGEGGEFDDALRTMGLLPPLPPTEQPQPQEVEDSGGALQEETKKRMEDNKRRAMEKLTARKKQQQQQKEEEEAERRRAEEEAVSTEASAAVSADALEPSTEAMADTVVEPTTAEVEFPSLVHLSTDADLPLPPVVASSSEHEPTLGRDIADDETIAGQHDGTADNGVEDIHEEPLEEEVEVAEGAKEVDEEENKEEGGHFVPVPESLDIAVDEDEQMERRHRTRAEVKNAEGSRLEGGAQWKLASEDVEVIPSSLSEAEE